ncbi:sensor histidine kinase [Acidisarcina polymorpha]|nr:sensor histidine kinase [Acidisarcina polymorpha]
MNTCPDQQVGCGDSFAKSVSELRTQSRWRFRLNSFWGVCAWLVLGMPAIAETHDLGAQATHLISGTQITQTLPVRPPVMTGSDIRFYRAATGDALSQVRVSQIVQDNQGFMWFGTQYGLNRYDGYKVKVFLHDSADPKSLSGVYITALFKDKSGSIWVGCNQFLDKYDPFTETFSHYQIQSSQARHEQLTIKHISQDSDGAFWLATTNGLFTLNPVSGLVKTYRHDPNNPSSLSSNDVKSSGEDREGNFWAVTREGLDKFDRKTGKVLLHVPQYEPRESFFYEDRYGVFWLIHALGTGLSIFNQKTNTLTPVHLRKSSSSPTALSGFVAILEDHDGVLWLGSQGGGLFRFDRDHGRFIQYRNESGNPNSLAENSVVSLYEDKEQNIWLGMGTREPNLFSTTKTPFESLPLLPATAEYGRDTFVGAVLKDASGDLWIGQRILRRLRRQASESTTYITTNFDTINHVISMVEDRNGSIWVGTFGDGLSRVDKRTGHVTTYRHDAADQSSLSSNIVTFLLIDHSGALWASTWDGLDRFDREVDRFTVYRPGSDIVPLFLGITEDSRGMLWVGTDANGVQRFDPATSRFSEYMNDPANHTSVSDSRVNSVFVDHLGTMWLATQNGVNKFDPGSGAAEAYYERDGLSGNVVSCIREDGQGKLWMSTNKGISSFDQQSRMFRNYFTADGLPGPDLTGWAACYKSPDGEMYFGGFSGGVAFHPELITETAWAPPVVFTDVRVLGHDITVGPGSPLRQVITQSDQLVLNHNQTMLSLEFAALSYLNPSSTRYRYKLGGLDSDWNQTGSNQRAVTYTSLPTGSFTFRVQATTGHGVWSQPGATLTILIRPAWWNSWWFRSIYASFLSLLVSLIYLYRVHQLRLQYSLRLEERVGERVRIARELHDTLLQGFHGLMLRFQVAMNLISEDSKAHSVLEDALDRADILLNESRDRIRDLRHETGPETPLVEALAEGSRELQKDSSIVLAAVATGVPRKLNSIIRDELYLIGREAIINAFRHSQGSRIEVEVEFNPSAVVLRVRDDGQGISKDTLRAGGSVGHWGLSGMRERAEKMGARLRLWNRFGAGTEVEVKVPGTIAYLNWRGTSIGHWLGAVANVRRRRFRRNN